MTPDRRDIELLRLTGKYRWLPLDKLSKFGFKDLAENIEGLAKLGYMGIARNKRYIKATPKGYHILDEGGYVCDTATNRPYEGSTVLRRRLEISEIMLTCLRAGIDPLRDEVDALRDQPVFLPSSAFRGADVNVMSNCTCAGFGHWGNAAYMLHYVSPGSKGMFLTNELKLFHNLSSIFSERLDTPTAMILAGDSYMQVYEQLQSQALSNRHGAGGFADFSEVYKRTELPIHLLSCDEIGAMQLAIMRQPDYNARIARAAFGDRWRLHDDLFPEADGVVDGDRPLIIAVDMDLRRVERVSKLAQSLGRSEVMVAAFESQVKGFLLDVFPPGGIIAHLSIEPVLDKAFGESFSLYSMSETVGPKGV